MNIGLLVAFITFSLNNKKEHDSFSYIAIAEYFCGEKNNKVSHNREKNALKTMK